MKTHLENEKRAIDIFIKLLLVLVLLGWCIKIILPFVIPVLWGVILAITLFPLYQKISKILRGRKTIASALITGVLLIILILPSIWLIYTIASEARGLWEGFSNNTLKFPALDENVRQWPVVGDTVYNIWKNLETNLGSAVVTYREQLLGLFNKLAGSLLSVTSIILISLFSVILSGIFMAIAEKSEQSALKFTTRLLGDKGEELLRVMVQTIRNVAKGILGVALIQFLLMGIVLISAQVPLAGLWALIVLFLAIVQLPPTIVTIPIIIYLYSVKEPLLATIFSILVLLVALSDNVLKPWLMGKGAPVPMLVIFIGALGGFMMMGFIGLFTGAMVLSVSYRLAGMWLES